MQRQYTLTPGRAMLLLPQAPDNVSVLNIQQNTIIYVGDSPAVSPTFGTPLGPGAVGNFPSGPLWAYSNGQAIVVVSDSLLTAYVLPDSQSLGDIWTVNQTFAPAGGFNPFVRSSGVNQAGHIVNVTMNMTAAPGSNSSYGFYSPSLNDFVTVVTRPVAGAFTASVNGIVIPSTYTDYVFSVVQPAGGTFTGNVNISQA